MKLSPLIGLVYPVTNSHFHKSPPHSLPSPSLPSPPFPICSSSPSSLAGTPASAALLHSRSPALSVPRFQLPDGVPMGNEGLFRAPDGALAQNSTSSAQASLFFRLLNQKHMQPDRYGQQGVWKESCNQVSRYVACWAVCGRAVGTSGINNHKLGASTLFSGPLIRAYLESQHPHFLIIYLCRC